MRCRKNFYKSFRNRDLNKYYLVDKYDKINIKIR